MGETLAGEAESAFPTDGIGIVSTLAGAVKKGRRFKEWELAGIKEGMLGRPDLTGIGWPAPSGLAPVGIAGPNANVLLITQDELDVAFQSERHASRTCWACARGSFHIPRGSTASVPASAAPTR